MEQNDNKRVFLIVLDSFGIGALEDAKQYGDINVNTFKSISTYKHFNIPNLKKLGIYNIDILKNVFKNKSIKNTLGCYGCAKELSAGKDTLVGHWEISGIHTQYPLPTYPNGFPSYLIKEFENQTGYKVLCNLPYSGTQVIKDYFHQHISQKSVIMYTSADSVCQIAVHTEYVPLNTLYKLCETARKIFVGNDCVGRIIARPFEGEYPDLYRTSERKDYTLLKDKKNMLTLLKNNNFSVIGVGKISNIFNNVGITESIHTINNNDGIDKLIKICDDNFNGLCFVNLVDFDMIYGHRNDIDGYAQAMMYFDKKIPIIINKMQTNDLLIITSDHGCDPGYHTTDHTREHTPILIYGKNIKNNVNLGIRKTYADIGSTIIDYFNINTQLDIGESFYNLIKL